MKPLLEAKYQKTSTRRNQTKGQTGGGRNIGPLLNESNKYQLSCLA